MKILKVSVLLLISFFMFSCRVQQDMINIRSQIKEEQLPKTCQGLNDLVAKSWYYDTRNGYYIPDFLFFDNLRAYLDCLKTLNVEQVKQIFGTPIYVGNGSMCYFIYEGCDIPYGQCDALLFIVKNDKVLNAGRGMCGRGMRYD